MGGGLVFGAFSLLVMPLLLGALLREAVLACTAPRRIPAQPECDACGYPVAGLQSMTCPECGGHLLVSGIRTAALEARRRGNLFWGLVSWTAFMALGSMMLLSVTMMFWGFRGAMAAGATQTSTTFTITPVSGSGPALLVSANRTTNDDTGALEQSTLMLSPASGGMATLNITDVNGFSSIYWTDANGAFRQPSMTGRGSAGLDAPTASAWLTGLGSGQSAGYSAEEVAEVVRIAGELSQDPAAVNAGALFTLTAGGTTSRPVASTAGMASGAWFLLPSIIMLGALGLWIAGMVYIPVRRRVLRARLGVTPRRDGRRREAAPV